MPTAFAACYYRDQGAAWPVDLGDDPSFGHAMRTGGRLTWGVCRPDLRNLLRNGDLVVFFAADRARQPIRYAWAGYATVDSRASQVEVFSRESLSQYRQYPNLLILPDPTSAGSFVHHEPALDPSEWHDDWLWRLVYSKRRQKGAPQRNGEMLPLRKAFMTWSSQVRHGNSFELRTPSGRIATIAFWGGWKICAGSSKS